MEYREAAVQEEAEMGEGAEQGNGRASSIVASIHLVRYRRPKLRPPRRVAEQFDGLHFWRPLNAGIDFEWHMAHPGRLALWRKLKPDFYRWAFFGVWESEAALDRFLGESPIARSWEEAAEESWHVWLRPVRAHGGWEGARILEGSGARGLPSEPAAFLTRLELPIRALPAMWLSAAPGILSHVPCGPDLAIAIGVVDRPYVQPMTFTLWRSAESAFRYAYDGAAHQAAITRVGRPNRPAPSFFSSAQFFPYRSRGTWKGRDPLGQFVNLEAGEADQTSRKPREMSRG